MPISIACACGWSMHVRDDLAGKPISCPLCKGDVFVPGLNGAERGGSLDASAERMSATSAMDNDSVITASTPSPCAPKKATPATWYRVRKRILIPVLVVTVPCLYWILTSGMPQTIVNSNDPDALKVLFIGNSQTFCNELPLMIARLTTSANPDQKLKFVQVVYGGATLEDHWEKYGQTRKAILERGPWDYVVLQEQSWRPISDPERMHRYVRLFDAEIKRVGAKMILFQTAAWRDYPETEAHVTWAYATISRELGAIHAPVGIVWAKAQRRHPGLALHADDGFHPSAKGTYLAACVFYAVLNKKSPEGLPCRLQRGGYLRSRVEWVDLPEDVARDIQRSAWETLGQ